MLHPFPGLETIGFAMNILANLLAQPRTFAGKGLAWHREDFSGLLEFKPLLSRSALLIYYSATSADGRRLHSEATLLGRAEDNEFCLWPVVEELPFIAAHPLASNVRSEDGCRIAVFATTPRAAADRFQGEITIELDPRGMLVYSHAWGLAGAPLEHRLSCTLSPSES